MPGRALFYVCCFSIIFNNALCHSHRCLTLSDKLCLCLSCNKTVSLSQILFGCCIDFPKLKSNIKKEDICSHIVYRRWRPNTMEFFGIANSVCTQKRIHAKKMFSVPEAILIIIGCSYNIKNWSSIFI